MAGSREIENPKVGNGEPPSTAAAQERVPFSTGGVFNFQPVLTELAVSVYEFTAAFPVEERYGLAAQMRRAAISVGSNIFEGCGRTTDRGFRASLGVAHAEACELAFQVRVATRLSFGASVRAEALKAGTENVRRMIFNLMRRLSTT